MSRDDKVSRLLKWINNTGEEEKSKPSSHSFISPRLAIRQFASTGRGLGASETIHRRETIIKIPHSFLLNTNTAIRHITKYNEAIVLTEPHYLNVYVPFQVDKSRDIYTEIYSKLALEELLDLSSFQLISLYIVFEKQRAERSFWAPFIDMLPSLEDLGLSPLIWKVLSEDHSEELIQKLPKSAKEHLRKMDARFTSDFIKVKALVAKKLNTETTDSIIESRYLPQKLYLWAWMCINSRCLYMNLPQSKNNSDNFTMAPYVDFLNHSSDDQCGIKIDATGFQVYTTTSYQKDEQLFFSYGPHSNVFLLCEYGFILPENKWNYLDISNYITPLLKPMQIEFLKEYDYYDDYTINEESGASFRTEVALAVLQEPIPQESRKLSALINGYSDGSVYQSTSNILLKKIAEKIIFSCEEHTKLEFSNLDGSTYDSSKKVVGELYRDMRKIAKSVLHNIEQA